MTMYAAVDTDDRSINFILFFIIFFFK